MTEYEERVRALEAEGLTTSDAQAIADYETGAYDAILVRVPVEEER